MCKDYRTCPLCGSTPVFWGDESSYVCGRGRCKEDRGLLFKSLLEREGISVSRGGFLTFRHGNQIQIAKGDSWTLVYNREYRDLRWINLVATWQGDMLDAVELWINRGRPLADPYHCIA